MKTPGVRFFQNPNRLFLDQSKFSHSKYPKDIGTRLPYAAECYHRLGCNFVLVAYRGYSNSDGVPSEKGLMRDGHAIMQEVQNMKDIDTNQIFVHGRSLGGAVATYVTTSRPYNISGVIIENTFTSISAMVDKIFPGVAFLKSMVLRNFWPSDQRVAKMEFPVLFIKAENDEIVPPEHMDILYDLCQSKKKEKVSFLVFKQ
jgi:pimeloyl-ACP methyl ester carboxylesterase